MGGGKVFTFGDTIPGIKRPVIAEEDSREGDIVASYGNFEPRFSAKYQLDKRVEKLVTTTDGDSFCPIVL